MTKVKMFLTTAAVCAGLAVSFNAANAQSSHSQIGPATSSMAEYLDPVVTLSQAVDVATAQGKGRLEGVFQDYSELGPVYIAELSSETSKTTFIISGETGEIIGTYSIEATSPEIFELMIIEIEGEDSDVEFDDKPYFHEEDEEDLEDLLMFLEDLGYSIEEPVEQ